MTESAAQRMAALTGVEFQDAICYSGYRAGQSPRAGVYPSYGQIKEDLALVRRYWNVIRIYDCSPHGLTVLKVIRNEFPDMRVLIGADLETEVFNPACSWARTLTDEDLAENRRRNTEQIRHVAAAAADYSDVVLGVSAGNEVTVDWTEHLVSLERVAGFLEYLKQNQPRPVTLCDNNVPWQGKLDALVPLVDFISIHSYPAWLNVPVAEALEWTEREYNEIAARHPAKPVIITEAGWTTASSGRGIRRGAASETNQAIYCRELAQWSRRRELPVFLFEAFDEPWKGSDDPDEPEKHWGLFREDRTPKPVMESYPAR